MFLIKKLCLIIFIIITILFTVGYATQPIVSNSSHSITPTGTNTAQQTIDTNFYITYFNNPYSQNTNYTSVSNDKQIILATLFYMCLGTTVLLSVGIILGFVGLKFFSKIVFFITLLVMIITFLIIQFAIVASSLVSMSAERKFTTPETSNGTGYYLILVATILMFVNSIIYAFLG